MSMSGSNQPTDLKFVVTNTLIGEPNIAEPQKRRLTLAQHRSAEDIAIR